jgi:hypothetical protein
MEFAQLVVSTPYVLNILVFISYLLCVVIGSLMSWRDRVIMVYLSGKEEMQLKAIIRHTLIMNFAHTEVNT